MTGTYNPQWTIPIASLRDPLGDAARRSSAGRLCSVPALQFTDEPAITRIVWLFSFVLGFSRLIWPRFELHEDMQTVLRCHMAAFNANAMTTISMPSSLALVPSLELAWQDVDSSFERFCLTAGIGAIEQMLCADAQRLAGAPHSRGGGRVGHRWGRTKGKIGFHGGNVAVHRPRVRGFDGHEVPLPTWTAAQAENWLGRWAMNLMLINVSTRKLRRAVRLPEGDLPVIAGDGTSKSATSRRFVALSAERLAEWMASDLSKLDLLVIQIDGLHIGNDLVLVAALGIDGEGHKHPLGLVEGATENAAVVQALIDNLIERGLDPKVCRLFIIDGAKALSKSSFEPSAPKRRSSAVRL